MFTRTITHVPDPPAVPLSVQGSSTVANVFARLRENSGLSAAVVYRGRRIGSVQRDELALAERHGLGLLPVRDVVVDAPLAAGRTVRRWNGRSLQDRLGRSELAALRRVATVAAERDLTSYLVGGTVRDLCLGRVSRDLDVVVDGDVPQLARDLGGSLRSHETFGTATVVLPSGVQIDLARARRERYVRPAALPEVSPGSMRQDLLRRDFAVNAMAVRLTRSGLGRLLDPCGGLEDLRLRRLRALHGLSFIEDPTRAFRAVRLATELGFRIAPRSSHLIRVALERSAFTRLSAARVRREIIRLLECSYPGRAVRALLRHGLLATLDPSLNPAAPLCRALDRIPAVLRWFRTDCGGSARGWLVGLGLLLRGTTPETVDRVLQRVQPGRVGRSLLVQAADRLESVELALAPPGEPAPSAIFSICSRQSEELLLMVLAGNAPRAAKRHVRRYLLELRRVTAAIGGRDLLAAGVPPGPGVARGLEAALMARLDGKAPQAKDQLRVALAAAGRS